MFRVLWLALKDTFDELGTLIVANLLWLLMSAPLMLLGLYNVLQANILPGVLVLLLSVLPAGPATAGLYALADRITEGRAVSVRNFFEGVRAYAKLSWQVYGLWTVGLIVIVTNLTFYPNMGTVGLFLMVVFLYLLVIWWGLLIYIGPLMLLQQDKRIRLIARNALLMTMGRPVFSLVTLLLMALILGLSFVLWIALPLLTFALLALWGFRATVKLVKDAEERQAARAEAAAEESSEKGRGGQVRPRQ
jgi:uncharacterized membrane protein YesL